MKYVLFTALTAVTLAAGPASAADMPIKALPPPVPVFSWSGIYVGGFVGAAWSDIRQFSDGGGDFFTTSSVAGPPVVFTATFHPLFNPGDRLTPLRALAPIGGLESGINLQMGPVVVGIETMWGGTRLRDHETDIATVPTAT